MSFYKIVNLFGEEDKVISYEKKAKLNLFSDYSTFVDKFKPKKTTDDCYTPPAVYRAVLDYVSTLTDLRGVEIIRPFFPDADYESINYPKNCIVVDNPPFSIVTKICRYYIKHNVKFFLFCPHLTAFSSDLDVTHIITNSDIIYENGANVKTAFVTNVLQDEKVIGCVHLHDKIKEAQKDDSKKKPKYKYPNNVLTVSDVAYCVSKGIPLVVNKNETSHCRGLDSQKKHKKAIFGSGFLISDSAAAKAAAAKAAAKSKQLEIEWKLSKKERSVIEYLNSKQQ